MVITVLFKNNDSLKILIFTDHIYIYIWPNNIAKVTKPISSFMWTYVINTLVKLYYFYADKGIG